MDFLELWKDCTKNVVSANKLVPLNEDKQIRIVTREKVLYRHITYIGVVLDSSEHAVSDSDDEPSINNNLTTPC